METTLHNPDKASIIHDRQQAIDYAFQHANTGDIVLVAGKGHEKYQQIGNERRPFSDREYIKGLYSQT